MSLVVERGAEATTLTQDTSFAAADGMELHGNWHLPRKQNDERRVVAVVACGAGIPARYYHRMAGYLAEHGLAVLTFDYRGIGASRRGDLRGLTAGMDAWAILDFGAALGLASRRFPDADLTVIAHSVGALYVGAAPGADKIKRMVFLGPHTGYWRDYRSRWRWLMFLAWHQCMPLVTRMFGYFPGHALRMGEDLPAQAALDWAQRRQPEIAGNEDQARRFGPGLSECRKIVAPTLAFSASDDAFAPPPAAWRLLENYPGLKVTHETVTPRELGCARLGHLGFLRRPACEFFWRRACDWLVGDAAAEKTAQSGGDRLRRK